MTIEPENRRGGEKAFHGKRSISGGGTYLTAKRTEWIAINRGRENVRGRKNGQIGLGQIQIRCNPLQRGSAGVEAMGEATKKGGGDEKGRAVGGNGKVLRAKLGRGGFDQIGNGKGTWRTKCWDPGNGQNAHHRDSKKKPTNEEKKFRNPALTG